MDEVVEKVEAYLSAFYANPPHRKIRHFMTLLNDCETGEKRKQVTNKIRFPPLPTGDKAIRRFLYLENCVADKRAKLQPIPSHLIAWQSQYIDIALSLHVEGDIKPLTACLHSSFFSFSPAQKAIIAELLDGRIKSKDGTKEAKCSYEYKFSRDWLVHVKGNPRNATIGLVAELFNTSESTVRRQMRKIEGTKEGRLIRAVIDFANNYPKHQMNLLWLYCQKLHGFLIGK